MVDWLSTLDRKLLRDLMQIKSQAIAISLVMAAGVAMLVMSLFARDALMRSKESFYQRYRFAEVFATAKRVPHTLAARLERIEGVAVVATRIVANVSLDVPGMSEPAVGRLLSIPDFGRAPLNDLYLKSGRWPDAHRSGEVLAGEAFCQAHQLSPGATIRAIINGRRQELTIVGIALSPEYLIQIQPGSLLPDDRRFGVFWMCQRQLAAAFNLEGAFNDVSLTLEHGAIMEQVIDDVDHLLEPYGCVGSYGRHHQTSNQYITDEIRQLSTMATLAPAIFLSVAAFLINVVITRQIGLQREQIAALKAFGYSNWAVGWHYLKMVIVIALVGVVIGFVGGLHLAGGLTRLYAELYRFPSFEVVIRPLVVLTAVGVSVAAAASGAWLSIRRAVRLPPAEAMRPEPPVNYRATLLERLSIGRWLPLVLRMILRHLERRPWKSLSAVFGIALAVSVLIVGSFSLDAVNFIMDFQFRWGQRQTLNFTTIEATNRDVLYETASWRGVTGMQTFRGAAVRLSRGHRWRRTSILGLDHEQDLFRLLNADRVPYPLPLQGLVLSEKLAELLHVAPGQFVTVAVLEGRRPTRDVLVVGTIREYGGLNAYMSQKALCELLGDGQTVSGAFLAIEADQVSAIHERLKNTPRIAGVTVKGAALESFRETIAKNLLTMRAFNVLFAVVIAFGVVYNCARISLSEQSRDLATLRVMGYTRGEAAGILLGELAVLTLAAIPVGCAIGYGLAALLILGLDTEVYRIPLIIERGTYAFAAVVVLIAAVISGGVVLRRIQQLDLIGVLKTRE